MEDSKINISKDAEIIFLVQEVKGFNSLREWTVKGKFHFDSKEEIDEFAEKLQDLFSTISDYPIRVKVYGEI